MTDGWQTNRQTDRRERDCKRWEREKVAQRCTVKVRERGQRKLEGWKHDRSAVCVCKRECFLPMVIIYTLPPLLAQPHPLLPLGTGRNMKQKLPTGEICNTCMFQLSWQSQVYNTSMSEHPLRWGKSESKHWWGRDKSKIQTRLKMGPETRLKPSSPDV